RRDPELREEPLHGGEDGVVAAPRAPPDLLIRGEVLLRERERARRGRSALPVALRGLAVALHLVHQLQFDRRSSALRHGVDAPSERSAPSSSSRIFPSSSSAKIGWPWTFEYVFASTRNRARMSIDSCPVFSSGINTVR